MPYNTRRKSISLPSLGIHLPVTNAARAAAKSLSLALSTNLSNSTNSHLNGISTATISNTTGSSSAVDKDTVSANTTHSSSTSSSSSSPTSSSAPAFSSPSSPSFSSSFSSSSSITTAASTTPTTPAAMPSKISPKRPAPDAGKVAAAAKRIKLRNPSATATTDQTPPSSPKRLASVENDVNVDCFAPVNMDGVVDDVVEAVVDLLQKNGNRPLLIKELENHLRLKLKSVQQSANPQAIICSRLSSFMKRPTWNKEKCPIAKELENTHPRRTYYYLTTCPNQPLPDPSSVHFILPRTMATPPISNISAVSESVVEERRREISPSPEFEFDFDTPLDTPELEFDDELLPPATPDNFAYLGTDDYRSHQRGASPPLERDEREFTQTAEGLQKQKNAGNRFMLQPVGHDANNTNPEPPTTGMRASPEMQLFGHQSRQLVSPSGVGAFGVSLDSPDQPPAAVTLNNLLNNSAALSNAIKNDELSELAALARFQAQAELGWHDEPEPLTLDDLDLFFAQNPL